MVPSETQNWQSLAAALEETVTEAYPKLIGLPDAAIEARPKPGKWSVKEMVGHLIDSASNNHQRFVRLQVADGLVFPDYSQDNDAWVSIQGYQATAWDELVVLWRSYNFHLARVIRAVDEACIDHQWIVDENTSIALGELMIDYLRHLKDHLRQIMRAVDHSHE